VVVPGANRTLVCGVARVVVGIMMIIVGKPGQSRSERICTAIAWWQIVGGMWGAWLLILMAAAPADENWSGAFLLFAASVCAVSIVAGVALLRKPEDTAMSICLQAVQVVAFNFGSSVFQIALTPRVSCVWLIGRGLSLVAGWIPALSIGGVGNTNDGVSINLVALISGLFLCLASFSKTLQPIADELKNGVRSN
jgi:hypothetical protein